MTMSNAAQRFRGNSTRPYYTTGLGAAFLGDSIDVLGSMGDESVNLVVTSPPYALTFKKSYGDVSPEKYVEWFLPYPESTDGQGWTA